MELHNYLKENEFEKYKQLINDKFDSLEKENRELKKQVVELKALATMESGYVEINDLYSNLSSG